MLRTRWAAIGAAVAVALGAGGVGLASATLGSGERAVYTAIEPCRLVDTRPDQGIGGRTTPLGPAETYQVVAHGDNGQCEGIPDDTLALELNVTGLLNTAPTFLTIWDGAGDVPNASHINLSSGQGPTPNSVTTELSGANFAVFNNSGTSHVIVDVVGIYQDHHHDDRYYRTDEVDALIGASGVEVVPIEPYIGGGEVFDYAPEDTAAGLSSAFTTSKAGYVTVTKFGSFSFTCSGANIVAVFLAVDGVGLPSAGNLVEGTTFTGRLSGVTDFVVAPGEHTLDIAIECLGLANEASTNGWTNFSTSSVIVHPADP